MKKFNNQAKRGLIFVGTIFLIISILGCKKENAKNLILIDANDRKGFNFPYLLFLPETISNQKEVMLIVESNNSGFASDNFNEHLEKATRTATKDFYIGNFIARKLEYPLLVPVFPRSKTDWKIYTHALDRDAVIQKNNTLEGLDIQLIKMIDNARDTLSKLGYRTKNQILLTGFSASGTFANRFSLIHPDRVFAIAAGGLNGLLMLPIKELNNKRLNYPIGTNDFKFLFNKCFDSATFKKIPQFLFMGRHDENDAILFDDGYDPEERETIFQNLGERMQPDRWYSCTKIYKINNINATLITFDSIGHEHPLIVKEKILSFFKTNIKNSFSETN